MSFLIQKLLEWIGWTLVIYTGDRDHLTHCAVGTYSCVRTKKSGAEPAQTCSMTGASTGSEGSDASDPPESELPPVPEFGSEGGCG